MQLSELHLQATSTRATIILAVCLVGYEVCWGLPASKQVPTCRVPCHRLGCNATSTRHIHSAIHCSITLDSITLLTQPIAQQQNWTAVAPTGYNTYATMMQADRFACFKGKYHYSWVAGRHQLGCNAASTQYRCYAMLCSNTGKSMYAWACSTF